MDSAAPVAQSGDLPRRLARTLATARLSAARPPLAHTGPCGRYGRCPRCEPSPVPMLELLPDGRLLVRCCLRRVLLPGDPDYAAFRAVFP